MKIVIFVCGLLAGVLTHHVACYMGWLEKFDMVCPCKKDTKVAKKKK